VYHYTYEKLIALDPATGGRCWPATGGRCWSQNLEAFRFAESPAVAGGLVFAIVQADTLSAFDAESGDELWRFEREALFGTPTIADGRVFVGSRSGVMYALDAATGALRGESSTRSISGGWAVADGVLFVSMDSPSQPSLAALDTATGIERWRVPTGTSLTSPVVVGDQIYVISGGALRVYDAATGAELWVFPIAGGRVSTPAVVDGVVYLATDAGIIYAIGGSAG
jgi:outer membrane protein assembly factor BamB